MILTTEQTALLQTRLAAAEEAYHNIRMGLVPKVFVDQNGERVEYAATNAAGLRAYILELKTSLGLPTGITGPLNAWAL